MKKYTIVLALMAVAPAFAAGDYYNNTSASEGYYTTKPAKANTYKTTTTSRKSGGYGNTIQNNFYYQQPARASSYDVVPRQQTTTSRQVYSTRYDNADTRRYSNDSYSVREKQVTTRTYATQERKYFLAHPFFQPLKGRFGSVTDFSYATNNFKFDILNASVLDLDTNSYFTDTDGNTVFLTSLSGKQETTQFLVKEDFSIGITDTLAIIGMLQYDRTKTSFKDWKDSLDPAWSTASDSYSSSGLNLFGIGLQDRFVDNDEWIAMVAGYYQHQKDTANTFIGELKAGYKVDRTTVYGLLRGGYSRLTKGDIYGAYVESGADYIMLSYKTDTKDVIYVEGGLGAFAVLNKYFTLNGELIYGHYDWHEQLNLKGAIGIQPADMFALNLYGSVAVYDSAKGKTKKYFEYDVNPENYATSAAYTIGDYKIKDYNEWKVGVQAILYF